MDKKMVVRKSAVLGEDLEVVAYGSKGLPVVAFAPLGQEPESLEGAGLVDELADYLDAGVIQLFCVNNVDGESWAAEGDPAPRAARQEAYYQAICDELVPLVHEVSGSDARPLALGFDMGATHAAIFALRRPDLFQGCVCLSGTYDARRYFGDWMDATLYDNTPCAFLPNMPTDHPYVALYNQRQLLFCTGQEASEADSLRTTRELGAQFERLGVDVWCDYWGADVTHSWQWWKKQIRYFLPIVLEDVEKTTAAEKPAKKAPARKRATTKKAAAAKPAATKAAKKETATKKAPAAKKAEEAPKAAAAEKPAEASKASAAEKPTAKKAATARKATTAKKAAEPKATAKATKAAAAKPAEKDAPLAKAAKPATPAKAVKPATPAKATKAAVPAKAEPAAKPSAKPAAKAAVPAEKAEPAAKAEPKPAAKAEPKATAKPAAKPAPAKAEPKPAAKKPTTKKRGTSAK